MGVRQRELAREHRIPAVAKTARLLFGVLGGYSLFFLGI